MPGLKIVGFDGEVPRLSPTLLGDSQAQQASNVKLYSGELRYWRGVKKVFQPALKDVQSIYKMVNGEQSRWLTWDTDVNVVSGALADLSDIRAYYTGSGVPKKTNWALASTGVGPYPAAYQNMGVETPGAAPVLVPAKSSITPQVDTAFVVGETFRLVHTPYSSAGQTPYIADGSGNQTFTSYATDKYELAITVDPNKTYVLHVGSTVIQGGTNNSTIGDLVLSFYDDPAYVAADFTISEGTGSHSGKIVVERVARTSTTINQATAGYSYDDIVSAPQVQESRVYVYTYVNEFGTVQEESAPSPASVLIDVRLTQPVTISGFSVPTPGAHNITKIRLYRSVAGANSASYLFVAEFPVTQTSYIDTLKTEELAEALGTIGWAPPPDDLQGLISMANGMMAGFVGNTVYLCEPYFHHAWPLRYAQSVPHKIIGLGSFGTSLVIMTDQFPYVLSGVSPDAMTLERVPLPEPCVSKRSIVSAEGAVQYASPNGLVGIGYNVRGLVTKNLFRRDEWQKYQPSIMVGSVFDGRYFGFFQSPEFGNKAMVLSQDDVPALSFFSAYATSVHQDVSNAALYYVSFLDNAIYQVDADDLAPFTYEWLSKRYVMPQAMTFSAFKLDADFDAMTDIDLYNQQVANIKASNQAVFNSGVRLEGALDTQLLNTKTLNGSVLQDLPQQGSTRTITVFIYGDGELVWWGPVSSFNPVRLTPFKARTIEVKFTGNTPIRSFKMATTIHELRAL